jgi:LEA14-like dessication related protein
MKPSRTAVFALATAVAAVSGACASTKAPSVRVAGLKFGALSVGGAAVDVALQVRNINPEDLRIERFDYELKINGKVIGRGFQPDPLMLGGFKEERVVSRLDLNLLRLPAAVKSSLERDRVDAQVKGAFYVRAGNALRKIKFGSKGSVDLDKLDRR